MCMAEEQGVESLAHRVESRVAFNSADTPVKRAWG
jgi:hypothetical protein